MSTLRHEETMEQYYARILDEKKDRAKHTLKVVIKDYNHYVDCVKLMCDEVSRDRRDWGFSDHPVSVIANLKETEILIFKDMGNLDPQAFSEKLSALGQKTLDKQD